MADKNFWFELNKEIENMPDEEFRKLVDKCDKDKWKLDKEYIKDVVSAVFSLPYWNNEDPNLYVNTPEFKNTKVEKTYSFSLTSGISVKKGNEIFEIHNKKDMVA